MHAPVALVDCNNFYASCERVFNPKIWGKPIVVLSNNDGMIVARSPEAKAIGIKMGEPLFKIKDLIKKHDIQVFSSNYALYGDMSHRVMAALEQFSPNVEIYSIDEAFVNLEGFEKRDLTKYCRKIRETVYKWTGIVVSVGLARTKTLAKLANHRAKRIAEYEGVLNILNPEDIEEHLKAVEVADIWGVGRKYSKLLNNYNIFTAYDLSLANDKWVKKHLTVMGMRTVFELRGIPCIENDYNPPPKKAIVCSRSFSRRVTTLDEVKEAVSEFISRAAEKMRKQHSAATLVTVFLRTNPFRKAPQYHNGVLAQMPVPTDSTSELIAYALKGTEQIFREGFEYYKVGVMLTGFEPFDRSQLSMFDTENRLKMSKVTELLDKINIEMGSGTLFYASSGIKPTWRTKAEKKSPRYTTSWKELPKVSALNKEN